ncbi:hypothetical protein CDAR_43871 [Caerostris darwini]|uniref:Uncharacterized protein n=1 Tax=Caerostris darwini TaxID=1538125 RepID=A0AAV4WK91_9ARAC|nr:hypothetical protein CDAR_43871 [Caerostris darwini]
MGMTIKRLTPGCTDPRIWTPLLIRPSLVSKASPPITCLLLAAVASLSEIKPRVVVLEDLDFYKGSRSRSRRERLASFALKASLFNEWAVMEDSHNTPRMRTCC